jgi:hypothetical protein
LLLLEHFPGPHRLPPPTRVGGVRHGASERRVLTPVIPTSGHLTGGVAETFRRSPFRNGGHHRHKSPAREPRASRRSYNISRLSPLVRGLADHPSPRHQRRGRCDDGLAAPIQQRTNQCSASSFVASSSALQPLRWRLPSGARRHPVASTIFCARFFCRQAAPPRTRTVLTAAR